MRLASLAMYTTPAPVAAATDTLWAFIRERLRRSGLADVPESLDKTVAYDDAWLRPDLLLAQTCGFPYVRKLRGHVRLVATPVYDLPGCDGPLNRSKIIVASTSQAKSLEDLRGLTAAINEPGSNSGSNLFRAAIAPLARDGRFFASVIETGGHLSSIDAVASGRADVAAIDCVTFGNTLRFDADRLADIRVLTETPDGPGLPFITSAATSDEDMALLRRVLGEIATTPALAEVRDTLSLRRFDILADSAYERLADLERQAVAAGYPAVA
jgi:ABC-type phosphate/phosphonate transport system substrate-binding protein